jgi:hypothetical protein
VICILNEDQSSSTRPLSPQKPTSTCIWITDCVSRFPRIPPTEVFYLLKSTLARALSMLGRTEALELRLLRARCSEGSEGRRPLDLANRFSMSVMDTTPVRRPESRAPGMPPGTPAKFWPGSGDCGVEELLNGGMMTVGGGEVVPPPVPPEVGGGAAAVVAAGLLGCSRGVAGALGDGEADSTTHMRWDLVATSLATVCPSVE